MTYHFGSSEKLTRLQVKVQDLTLSKVQQSMVILRPVVFLRPAYPNGQGGDCVMGEEVFFRSITNQVIANTSSIEARVYELRSVYFGSTESCAAGVMRFIELEDLLQSTSRVDEMLDRLESLEQRLSLLSNLFQVLPMASA